MEAGHVEPVCVVVAEELPGIADACVPAAIHRDDCRCRNRTVAMLPGFQVVRGELCIEIAGGAVADVNDNKRADEFICGNALGGVTVGAVKRSVDMRADMFVEMPAVDVPHVLAAGGDA